MKKKSDCSLVLCACLVLALVLLLLGLFVFVVVFTPAPETVRAEYTRMLAAIEKIPIYDNHSHPGYADDPDVDAMTAPPSMSVSERLGSDNPELIVASRSMF